MTLDLKKIVLTKEESVALADRMSNWDKLHASMVKKPLDLRTLEKMIKVEVTGRKRLLMASRLLGVYHRLTREANEQVVKKALVG